MAVADARTALELLLGLLAATSLLAAPAVTLYVGPTGNDAWTGKLQQPNAAKTDGPLASLRGARDAVRKLRADGPVNVVIGDGLYPLSEPLVFGPEDSGEDGAEITYQAAPGATPVFSGGRQLSGFKVRADGLWELTLPEVKAGTAWFDQLWVNGRRAIRSRNPNRHYCYMLGKVDYAEDPATGQAANLASRAFIARPDDIAPLKALTPEQLKAVEVTCYHSWEASRHHIAAIDPKTNLVVLTGNAPWPMLRWAPNQRYHYENLPAAIDQPGEWCLGKDGQLLYQPRPGEEPAKAEAFVAVNDTFLRFAGEPALGLMVHHLKFQGLAFRHGQYLLPLGGHGDGQAAVTIPAVILADGAHDLTFEDCEVGHVGTYGLWFRRGCRDCLVSRCYLHDLGAGGVKIGETSIRPDEADRTKRITVDNTIINQGGRTFPGCIGVWIGQSGENHVTHCDISDLYYTGVSVGWRWGYAESLAKDNHIDFNRIHHIGQGVLSDMGGVYTLGPSPGSTVDDNVVHDVHSYDKYGRGGWGLYNDEGTSFIEMKRNLVHDVKTGGYHQHYGRENVIENNIFADSMNGQLQRSRVEEHLSFTFRHNIVYWHEGPLLSAGKWDDDQIKSDSNVFWNAAGEPVKFYELTIDQIREKSGNEVHSVIENPQFVDAEHGDWHLKPTSPALKLGFQPFDYTKAGLYGDPAWVAKPRSFAYVPLEFAPEPPPAPPLMIHEDFEPMPAGARPSLAKVYDENHHELVGVDTTLGAAGSKHCFRIADRAGLEHEYDPHFYFQPNHKAGTAVGTLDIRITDGTKMYHHWRDYGTPPYQTGPEFTIENGSLSAGGQQRVKLPVDHWVHVEMRTKLGAESDGTWSLTVQLEGQAPQTWDDLKCASSKFKALDWWGFSSTAQTETVYYLDNLNLTCEPGH